jgi:hypothetical protein
MDKSLSLGKLRGLQEIANPHGLFTITALDHRGIRNQSVSNRWSTTS